MTKLAIKLPTEHLYRQYQGQSDPQPSYVFLDLRSREVWADYTGEIGNAVPIAVWHGVVQRWALPSPQLTPAAIAHLVSEIRPLLMRVAEDSVVEWKNTNEVGELGDDAEAASEEIASYLGAFWINDNDLIELDEDGEVVG